MRLGRTPTGARRAAGRPHGAATNDRRAGGARRPRRGQPGRRPAGAKHRHGTQTVSGRRGDRAADRQRGDTRTEQERQPWTPCAAGAPTTKWRVTPTTQHACPESVVRRRPLCNTRTTSAKGQVRRAGQWPREKPAPKPQDSSLTPKHALAQPDRDLAPPVRKPCVAPATPKNIKARIEAHRHSTRLAKPKWTRPANRGKKRGGG